MKATHLNLKSLSCSKATDTTRALSYASLEKQPAYNHENDASLLDIQIVTKIRPPHPFPGTKSTQYIRVNLSNKTVTSDFWTGQTKIGNFAIKSAGDQFLVSGVSFAGSMVSFIAIGRTAIGTVSYTHLTLPTILLV